MTAEFVQQNDLQIYITVGQCIPNVRQGAAHRVSGRLCILQNVRAPGVGHFESALTKKRNATSTPWLSTAFRNCDHVFARRAPRSGAGNVAGGKREARNPR